MVQCVGKSTRMDLYRDALASLVEKSLIFSCSCTRRSLPPGQPYPGRCRACLTRISENLDFGQPQDYALRMLMADKVNIVDGVQGPISIDLTSEVGDVIVRRKDGLVSYSLACAVDDGTDTTQVVRGADLLQSSAAQIRIMQSLALQPPSYAHLPPGY